METKREYSKKTLIGQIDGENIYLDAPSWDCGWYWGFGYLGNNNCDFHVSGLSKDKNLHGAFIDAFGGTLRVKQSQLLTLAELFETFYNLKKTAEVLGRGGSHLSSNPCKDAIINKEEVDRINREVMPEIFDKIYDILEEGKQAQKHYKKIVSLDIEGDTSKTLAYMLKNNIKPEDLKSIKELTKDDYYRLHGAWWKNHHANEKKQK